MSRLETWYSWYLQSADIYTGCQPPPSSPNIPHTISRLCDPSSVRNISASRASRRKTNKSAVDEPFYAQYEKFQNNLSLKTQQSTYYDGRVKRCTPAPCQPLWPVSLSPDLSSVLTSSGFLDDVRGPPGNCVHAAPPPPAAVLWLSSTPAHTRHCIMGQHSVAQQNVTSSVQKILSTQI